MLFALPISFRRTCNPRFSYLNPRAGGRPPVNTTECFLQGPRVWGWLWFGLLCRLWLWLFRVCGGFVCPFRRFAFCVGRPARRRFRLSLTLVRVWCWFWSFVFGLGFWSCAAVSFYFFLCTAPRVGRHRPKLENLRCEIIVFK